MTTLEFEQLALDGRIDLLRREAIYLMGRRNLLHNVFLYAVDGFYVEVFYHRESNRIHNVEVIRTDEALNIYLDNIQLEIA